METAERNGHEITVDDLGDTVKVTVHGSTGNEFQVYCDSVDAGRRNAIDFSDSLAEAEAEAEDRADATDADADAKEQRLHDAARHDLFPTDADTIEPPF